MSDNFPSFNPEKYVWLKNQREIDFLDLDGEIMRMPVLIQDCGEITAAAIEIKESSKDELEKVKSTIGRELRELGKSESAIASMLPSDSRYIQANALLSEARLDAGLWQSLMESLRTKSSGLRVAADLIGVGFITQATIMQKRRKELRQGP